MIYISAANVEASESENSNDICDRFKNDACVYLTNCGTFNRWDDCISFYKQSDVCENNSNGSLKRCYVSIEKNWNAPGTLKEFCKVQESEESCEMIK